MPAHGSKSAPVRPLGVWAPWAKFVGQRLSNSFNERQTVGSSEGEAHQAAILAMVTFCLHSERPPSPQVVGKKRPRASIASDPAAK